MQNKLFLLIGLLFLVKVSHGQTFDFPYSKFSKDISMYDMLSATSPVVLEVEHDKWTNWTSYSANAKFKTLHDFVKFHIDYGNDKVVHGSYVFKIAYQLKGYTNPNTPTVYTTIVDTLVIAYNTDSLKAYQDKFNKKYSGFHKMEITVLDIYSQDNAGAITPLNLTDASTLYGLNCRLEGEIWVQYYNKNYYGYSNMTPLTVYKDATNVYSKRELNVSWNLASSTEVIKPAMYELEWTYIDDYKYDLTTHTASNIQPIDLNYSFKNNATRILTKDTVYKLPIVYEKGYIVYRVRMIRPDSINYLKPVYGQWSIDESGTLDSVVSTSNCYHNSQSFMNDSLNWQYGISFAEDGKFKHVVSYFDGLLHNKQVTTKVNSDSNYIIVSKSIEDYEGRPAIQFLPIPVLEQKVDYVKDFAINSQSNNYYKASDFDSIKVINNYCSPPAIDSLSTNSKAYAYYSPLNTIQTKFNKFIPNANGYPMVQTIASPENPKKILTQGGAGKYLQIDKGHASEYLYSGVTQQDLNRFFGTEIGKSSFFNQTVVQDPNGQSSLQVTNSDGKVVYTTMLGNGPDSLTHPIDSIDLPPILTYTVNVMDNVVQTTTPSSLEFNTAYYNMFQGNHSVQYSNQFSPFPTCDSTSFLSVKSKYYYEVLDKCLNIVDSASGSLGVNGVINSGAQITNNGPIHTPSIDKGNVTINKILSFSPSDIEASVDSFINMPNNCLHNEDYFIRNEIESKKFPCGTDTSSPCDFLKDKMIDELYPDHKYGKYEKNSDSSYKLESPNLNSIFTDYNAGFKPNPGPNLRYQDNCLTLPSSIQIESMTYTNIKQLPVDTFIKIFNDQIADSLLPLHPEYCKLKACYLQNDRYSDSITNIVDVKQAKSIGKFNISAIADADPLFLKGLVVHDSLVQFTGKPNRIDSFALMQTYCGGLYPRIITTSLSDIYHTELISTTPFTTADSEPIELEFYYGLMSQTYISNRESIKTKLMANVPNTCGPCSLKRMTLIPDPVFPDIPLTGGVNSQGDSLNQYLTNNNLTGVPQWMADALTSGNINSVTLDSINAGSVASSSSMCSSNVASIMSKFKNCTLDPNILNQIKDSLMAIFCTNQEKWSTTRISELLMHLNITETDICNPYIFQFNDMPGMDLSSENVICKSESFYKGALDFFNSSSLISALSSTASTITVSSSLLYSNEFEKSILTALGYTSSTTATIDCSYISSENQYKLEIYVNPSNKVTLWAYGTSNAQPFSLFDPLWKFTSVECLTDYSPLVLPTDINLHTIVLQAQGAISGTNTVVRYLAYNDKFKTLETNSNPNKISSDATACVEVSRWYKDAKSTMDGLGIKFNHQHFERTLLTLINSNTNKLYTYDDISEFMKSCAVTDSVKQLVTIANWELNCSNTSSANILLSDINNLLGYVPDYLRYKLSSGHEVILLSYNNMTDDSSYYLMNNFINSYSSSTISSRIYNRTYGIDTLALVLIPNSITTSPSATDFANNTDVNVVNATTSLASTNNVYVGLSSTSTFKLYAITFNNISSIPAYKIARYSDSLNNFISHNYAGSMVLSNYAGMLNEDYYTIPKQDWLHFNYTTYTQRHDSVLQRLTMDSLSLLSSFAGKHSNYGHPDDISKNDAIYINDTTDYQTIDGYNILNAMFECLGNTIGTLGGGYPSVTSTTKGFAIDQDSLIVSTSCNPSILNGGANSLKLFRCGSYKPGTYMIRYFNNVNKLFTVYFDIPTSLPQAKLLVRDLTKVIKVGPGDGPTYRFKFEAFVPGTYSDIKYQITGYTDFNIGNTLLLQNSLLKPSAFSSSDPWDTTSCERDLIDQSILDGRAIYHAYIDSVRDSLTYAFRNWVMSHLTERFDMGVKDRRYYNTLYYYDRAGNLTRTVPPGGSVEFDVTNTSLMSSIDHNRDINLVSSGTINSHKKVSSYKYNSFNQVFEQNTPDGGLSHFYYDAVGRLIYSQNAKQAVNKLFSYTLYDEQGRIKEVGEFKPNANGIIEITESYTKSLSQITALIISNIRTEVCATSYDEEAYPLQNETGMSQQENLRKRVSASKYFSSVGVGKTGDTLQNYNFASYYSYDIQGNVKTLTHDYKELLTGKQRFKRIDYQYDLYSGKVNMVSYNRSFADQFYQKYSYDKDNRVVLAETSKDGVYWDRDAAYEYYPHGPLARTSLGDLNVQGIDYAYTIQGWLKAINGDVLDSLVDMGGDGKWAGGYLKDIFSLTLDYFGNDYQSISSTPVSVLQATTTGLFNGNITRQNIALQPFANLNKNYRYDPLNRLLRSRYTEIKPAVSGPGYDTTFTPEYAEQFKYDLDGNIQKIVRKGNLVSGQVKTMDSMEYFYNANGVNLYANAKASVNSNKLNNVFDYANHGTYSNDIPYHSPSTATPIAERFKYDAIGNMISDQMNGINNVSWNLYGKVSNVSMPNDASDKYTYDATGNRISKAYSFYNKTKDTLTELRDIYVRDAQGNILAVYNDQRSSVITSLSAQPCDPFIDYGVSSIPNFQNIVSNAYAENADFGDAIVQQAARNSAAFSSIYNDTYISEYFWVNPQLFLKTISYSPNSISLFKSMNPEIVDAAIQYYMPMDLLVENICMPLDSDLHIKAAIQDIGEVDSNAKTFLMEYLGIPASGDHGIDNDALFAMSQDHPTDFRNALLTTINSDALPDFKLNYVNALIDDAGFYPNDSSAYYAHTHKLFCETMYTMALDDYLSMQAMFNDLEDDPTEYKATLGRIANPAELMATNYSIDDSAVIAKTCAAIGSATVLKTSMGRIRGMTIDRFLDDLSELQEQWDQSLLTNTTLIKDHFYLAEHHLYGSSRLGIKKYLPYQYDYTWTSGAVNIPIDSSNISVQQAWYNNSVNDFVKFTNSEYTGSSTLDKTPWISNRLIGLKNYELTNHLGNVQATVLDKYTPRIKNVTDTAYSIWNANLTTASDYYPFGSPMPGRYTSDTTTQSVLVTTPFASLHKVKIDSIASNSSHFTWSTYGPMSTVAFLSAPSKVQCTLSCPSSGPISYITPYGLDLEVKNLVPNKAYTLYVKYKTAVPLTFKFEKISPQLPFLPLILQSTNASGTGAVLNLAFTSSLSGRDTFHCVIQPCGITYTIDSIALVIDTITTSYVTSILSSETLEDKYRFGFNGQEKVNEIAGIGNHNTALFWEYDTRLGRRWNLDPKTTIGISDYSCFANNPVYNFDLLGDTLSRNEALAISAHVYGNLPDKVLLGGWRVSTRDFGIVKKTDDGFKSQVYERTKADGSLEFTYATSGTDFTELQDWKNNLEQGIGMASSQYKTSIHNAELIKSKTNGLELTFTGHSLGGGEAAANAYATGMPAITFNAAGVSPLTVIINPKIKIDAYIMITDPLNTLQNGVTELGKAMPDVNGTRNYVMPKTIPALYNGHSIDNFYTSWNLSKFPKTGTIKPVPSRLDNFPPHLVFVPSLK